MWLSGVWGQVHRGVKGVVKDSDGNAIKGATVTVRGIRKDVTTGKSTSVSRLFGSTRAATARTIYGYATWAAW